MPTMLALPAMQMNTFAQSLDLLFTHRIGTFCGSLITFAR